MYGIPVMYSSAAHRECESLAGDNDLLNLIYQLIIINRCCFKQNSMQSQHQKSPSLLVKHQNLSNISTTTILNLLNQNKRGKSKET